MCNSVALRCCKGVQKCCDKSINVYFSVMLAAIFVAAASRCWRPVVAGGRVVARSMKLRFLELRLILILRCIAILSGGCFFLIRCIILRGEVIKVRLCVAFSRLLFRYRRVGMRGCVCLAWDAQWKLNADLCLPPISTLQQSTDSLNSLMVWLISRLDQRSTSMASNTSRCRSDRSPSCAYLYIH